MNKNAHAAQASSKAVHHRVYHSPSHPRSSPQPPTHTIMFSKTTLLLVAALAACSSVQASLDAADLATVNGLIAAGDAASAAKVEVLEAKYVLKHATIATCSKGYFARYGHCGVFMLSRSPKFSGFDVGC